MSTKREVLERENIWTREVGKKDEERLKKKIVCVCVRERRWGKGEIQRGRDRKTDRQTDRQM